MKIKSTIIATATTALLCLTSTNVFAEPKALNSVETALKHQNKQINKINKLDKKQFNNQINKVDGFWFFDRKVDDSLFKELGAKGEDMCIFQYDYNKTNKVMSYMLIDDCSKHIKFGEQKL